MDKEVVVITRVYCSDMEGKYVCTQNKAKKFSHDTPIGVIMGYIKEVNADSYDIYNLE